MSLRRYRNAGVFGLVLGLAAAYALGAPLETTLWALGNAAVLYVLGAGYLYFRPPKTNKEEA